MSAETARLAWGALALASGACSAVGLVAALDALRVAIDRRRGGDYVGRLIAWRDLWMLGALALASALGVATALVLLALLRWYGPDLDRVLADLALPVLAAYAGYAAQTALVGLVAPVWLIARWRALAGP